MRTIDWVDGHVLILDQTLLPHQVKMVSIATPAELADAIIRLAVRGAMALGVAGAFGIALAAFRAHEQGRSVDRAVDEAAALIKRSRPTAVNLPWGVDRALEVRAGGPLAILAAALAVRDQDITANRAIGQAGARMLQGVRRVLTHCNAGALAAVETGTALAIVERLHQAADLEVVYVCETRPLLQGSRLTAWELGRAGIPHRIIVDGAAAGLILSGAVDAVVVGADRIAANGDVVNKVGTVGHALAARRAGIPFVVGAPEATIDPTRASGRATPIEERDQAEVLDVAGHRAAAPGSTAFNPAFDITPADLVTAIVTERRVLTPASSASSDGAHVAL
jgi:methylthioribose-1-phosphate isomerase